jgi:uncharacterized protein
MVTSKQNRAAAGERGHAQERSRPAKAAQPLRPRRQPQRTCIACRSTTAKRGLVRLVRTPDGRVEVDPTGKKPGRGAYLCEQQSCWESAIKKERINAAFKIRIRADDVAQLRAYAATLPADEE